MNNMAPYPPLNLWMFYFYLFFNGHSVSKANGEDPDPAKRVIWTYKIYKYMYFICSHSGKCLSVLNNCILFIK